MGQFWAELTTALLLVLLPLLFPHKPEESFRRFTPAEIALLKPELNRYNWIAMLVILSALIGCVALATDFLFRLFTYLPFPGHQMEKAFPFLEIYLIWPGIAFGFALSMYVIDAVMKRLMGRKYPLLFEASSQQYDMNGRQAIKGLVRFSLGAGIILLFLGYNWYAGLRGNTLVINPLLDVREKQYPLEAISRLTFVDHLRINPRQTDTLSYYEVAFNDGYVWNTREGIRYHMQHQDKPVIEYIARQRSLPIDTMPLYEYSNP